MKLKSPYLVKPGSKVKLGHWSTSDTGKLAGSEAAEPVLERQRKHLSDAQDVLYAAQSKALLIEEGFDCKKCGKC